jgi:hypothetical protein
MNRSFLSLMRFFIAILTMTLTVPGLAQKKGAGNGGASNANSATPSASSTGATQTTNAPIEEQVLAFKSLDAIAQKIAVQVCLRSDIKDAGPDATILIFDQATFANIQSYEAFVANTRALKAAYKTITNENQPPTPKPPGAAAASVPPSFFEQHMSAAFQRRLDSLNDMQTSTSATEAQKAAAKAQAEQLNNEMKFLSDITISPIDPFGDLTSFLGAIATSANTETAGTIVIPDSAMAVAVTREFRNLNNGCTKVPQVIYPPLFGSGSATDYSSAYIQGQIEDVDDARDTAIEAASTAFHNSQSSTAPAGNSVISSEVTDINGLYDSFMNSLFQVNASSGIIGSASVIQGYQLMNVLAGYPKADGTPTKKPAFVLLASVLSAGGTEHDHKSFVRSLGPGDQISYSGGVIVNVALWQSPRNDGNTTSETPIYADVLRYRIGFTKFKTPSGKDIGDDIGNNLGSTPAPTQP